MRACDAQVHAGAGVAGIALENCSKLPLGALVLARAQVQHAEHQPRLQVVRVVLLGVLELLQRARTRSPGVAILHTETRAQVGEARAQGHGFLQLLDGLYLHAHVACKPG